MFLISGLGMISLKHYGKCEVLRKITNIEAEYDETMHFDPDLLLATSVAASCQGLWDYGIEVAGAPKKYAKQTHTLEAGMYGFKGGEELLGVKGYLYGHGKYQLVLMSIFSSIFLYGLERSVEQLVVNWSHCYIFMFVIWSCCFMHYIFVILLQTDSAGGNCLFAAIKVSMNICHPNSKDAPYYPTRYFRRQVVAWMVKHHQLVVANKGGALMANYSLEEENDQFKGPLSFKQYLWHVLQHHFWRMHFCMWNLWIMVLNSRTLEEY